MNRRLNIPSSENPGAALQRSTPSLPGREVTDPGSNYVMPPPDGGRIALLPDDPSARSGGTRQGGTRSGGTKVCGDGKVVVHVCACAPPACASPAPAAAAAAALLRPGVSPQDFSGFVIVRMAPGIVAQSPAENLWTLAELHTPKLTGLQAVLELALPAAGQAASPASPGKRKPPAKLPEPPSGVLVSRPLVELKGRKRDCPVPLPRLECLNLIRDLEKQAALTVFRPLHSLADYWRLDLRQHPDLVADVVARLNRLAEVDLAYRELTAAEPQLTAAEDGQFLEEDQGYLDEAPLGISASWAWQQLSGSPQTQMTVCDLEQGWNPAHQDLQQVVPPLPLAGANRTVDDGDASGNHGTAVLGELAAAGTSSYGVRGAAAQLGRFVLASHYLGKTDPSPFAGSNGHVAAAIVQALCPAAVPSLSTLVPLQAGDVLLLEVQRGLLPAEVDEADFDAIRLASAHHVVVVEAAGNGDFDLDSSNDPDTDRSLRRGDPGFEDSGAILVGAAYASLPHDRAPFSNYGSRVDCFAWGEAVTTCGFGDLAGTVAANFYTNQFDGTSSASPIIAGAAALLQSLYQARTGQRLEPWAMRALLGDPATGTPQGPDVPGHIGVMPDLKAIVRDELQLVPDVYLRRSLGDDGSAPAPADDISSSPDILAWSGTPPAATVFGEGSLRENLPAPGDPIQAGASNDLYVRLRNRGLGDGDVHVQLFASPAATLITPERWIPVGSLDVSQVPQGDTLSVAGPVPWAPGTTSTVGPFWSLLAIYAPPGEGPATPLGPPYYDWAFGLPPGPPYFEWEEYRAFLRRPGVAWRNTYRVTAATSVSLPFLIAGTPDQARAFDLEVIQRLPRNAAVTLQALPALDAKLRQRKSWPGGTPGSLPSRPRITFNQVQLAAGARADATFVVTADANDPLTAGHSLALRQLWRGEEVGRITWFFGAE